jgi:hypothetical protein
MGLHVKNLILATLLASAIAVPASAAELVSNGGFESPYGLNQGWSYTVSNTLSIFDSSAAAHSGDKSLWFTSTASYVADFVYQSLDTVVGETYTWSYWLKGGTSNADAESNFHGLIGTQSTGYMNFSGDFGWQHFTGTYVATSALTEIYFEGFNSQGFYLLDDVSVTGPLAGEIDIPGGGNGVPEPATWAMMLLGFFGIGATLRRRNAGGLALAA